MSYTKNTWVTGDIITQEKLNHMEDGIEAAGTIDTVAPEFSTSASYAIGDYCMYNTELYRFIFPHAAGAWNAGDVVATKVMPELSAFQDEVTKNTELDQPINLLNKDDYTLGYISTAGVYTSSNNYYVTNYIAVKPGQLIKYYKVSNNAYVSTYMYIIAAYDADKTIMSSAGASSNKYSYVVPTGVKYLRISLQNSGRATAMLVVDPYVPTEYVAWTPSGYVATPAFIAGVAPTFAQMNQAIVANNATLTQEWEYVTPKNWLDPSKITSGSYINASGTVYSNASYGHTDKLSVVPGDVITLKRSDPAGTYPEYLGNYAMSYLCAYDENGNVVASAGFNSSTNNYVVPSGICEVVISGYFISASYNWMLLINNATETLYSPYFDPYWRTKDKFMPNSYDQLVSASVGQSPARAYSTTLTSNGSLVCGSTQVLKNKVISFRASISSMGQFTIFNGDYTGGTPLYYDSKLVIDSTTVTVYTATTSTYIAGFTATHGLTLKNYINVEIDVDNHGVAALRITTNGGEYTHDAIGFHGRGDVAVTSESASFTDVYLSWTAKDLKQPLWIFGDSYIQVSNSNYWPYHLINAGYTDYLISGFPGAKSKHAYKDWRNCLQYGKPKYVLWALGMNDSDTSAVNSEWDMYYTFMKEDCEALGVTLILATIPNVPARNHTYKNSIVTASGYRYVNFAQAVGATSAGSSWFDGMLQTDEVHPTTQGAKCLAAQVLVQLPELTQ